MNQTITQARPHAKTAAIVSILVVLALLLNALPQFTQSAAAATCSKKYTVVAGDTLSSIAAKYNTTVQVLAQLNDLKEPYVLSVGQVLCLPADAKLATPTPKPGEGSSDKPKYDVKVTRDGTRINVKVSSFPNKSNFIVRVGEELRHPGWKKIGKIKTGKSGSGEATFGLPDYLRKSPSYYVCFKNQVTDKLICSKVFQTIVNPNATAKPTAWPTKTPTP